MKNGEKLGVSTRFGFVLLNKTNVVTIDTKVFKCCEIDGCKIKYV